MPEQKTTTATRQRIDNALGMLLGIAASVVAPVATPFMVLSWISVGGWKKKELRQ
ncbi:hypothetical protein B0H21DRAFT_826936 [Amylocystis lapponica]|nr:hypothetical protein B0H21DRAFT_826936 [Amylocystis lapponica]